MCIGAELIKLSLLIIQENESSQQQCISGFKYISSLARLSGGLSEEMLNIAHTARPITGRPLHQLARNSMVNTDGDCQSALK